MRSAGLAGCILLAGCNQIFGLNQTSVFDATVAVDLPDAAIGTVLLTFELEDTDMSGAPEVITFPLLAAPIVQVAANDDDLAPATYSPPNMTPGSIPVPLLGGDGQGHVDPYRFVYQLDAASIPHEVQWNLQAGHVVVPVFGHPDRATPPAGSGYDFKPVGAPTGMPLVVAFTSGIWTTAHGDLAVGEFSYVFPTASTTLDGGTLGTPTVARGDSEYVVEVDQDMTCNVSVPGCLGTFASGFATMAVDLVGGAPTLGTPTWKTPLAQSFSLAFTSDNRIRAALGSQLAISSEVDTFLGGEVTGLKMPAFTIPGTNGGFDTTMLAQLAFYSPKAPQVIQWVDPFPPSTTQHAVVVSRLVERMVGTAMMASGLQTLLTPTTLSAGDLTAPAAMPTNAMIGSAALLTDGVPVDGTGKFLTLTFVPEAGHTNDDYIVTLFDVGAGNTPLRTFQVLLPSVRIPTDILTNGHTYAVQIVGRFGFPGAQVGDYGQPRLPNTPFGTATATPGTFTVTK